MIVYVESNFLLELSRCQEDFLAAEEILRLSEEGTISLAVPAFSISEPFSSLNRYGSDRAKLVDLMQREIRELARLQPHADIASVLHPLGQRLLSIEKSEMDALTASVARVLQVGTIIPLTPDIFERGRQEAMQLGLSIQDAVIYAAILADLETRPAGDLKCFVSRNARDFDDPGVTDKLGQFGCRYIVRYRDALDFIRNRI